MKNLKDDIRQNIIGLRAAKEYIEKSRKKEPKGSLRISKSISGKPRYYHKYKDDDNRLVDKFIHEKNMQLIRSLAEKAYHNKLYPAITKELNLLENFDKSYFPDEKMDIYRQLTVERKNLVTPIFIPPEVRAEHWKNEKWEKFDKYQEGLRYETDRGDMVRSKSEVIIANILYQQKDKLCYRYEAELFLKKANMSVHPDFTIMNRNSGRIYYWEHLGMLSDSVYADEFVRKMNWYIAEGIMPGDQLILSFETAAIPLNIKSIRKMIDWIV